MKVFAALSSTIGKKILVALTGLFMIIFLLVHLVGNLGIFSGPETINSYSAFLHSMPMTLWTFRILLIASVAVHIGLTISLTQHNQKARLEGYLIRNRRKTNLASRTMMISGLTIAAFVAYHLAHYTFGITDPELLRLTDDQGRHNVYNMLIMGFSHPVVSGFYILSQALLAFHLSHGVSSATRTLGVIDKRLYERIRVLGVFFAGTIALLHMSIPVSVMLGLLPLDY